MNKILFYGVICLSALLFVCRSTPAQLPDTPKTSDACLAGALSAPQGQEIGYPGIRYAYTAAGAKSASGNPLEYQFDWGNGASSAWSRCESATNAWNTEGAYSVRARARDSVKTNAVSGWSPALMVTIIIG